MLIITTQNPVFGKGYFIGFNKEGLAVFSSDRTDKRMKRYKAHRNAAKTLARIKSTPPDFEDDATYSIDSAISLIPTPGSGTGVTL